MRNIFKSFFKTAWKNWYQSLAFIIFIIISSALTIGFTSNALQITIQALKIQKQETKWDFSFGSSFWEFEPQYIYDYFQNENGMTNDVKAKMLNLESEINVEADGQTFRTLDDYLRYAFDNYQKDFFTTYELFIANFMMRSVFDFAYLYSNEVLLPQWEANALEITTGFFQIVNPEWHFISADYYGSVHIFLIDSLIKKYNALHPDQKIIFDLNFNFQYFWNTPQLGNRKISYQIEPVNNQVSDNVITDLPAHRIQTMKDDEILINSKFAQLHNLKIGDTIKINSAKMKDEDPQEWLFSQQYKIIGYGIKTSNLFALDQLKRNSTSNGNDNAYIYVTNQEMQKYIRYFWYYDNRWILPNNSQEVLGDLPSTSRRLRMDDRSYLAQFHHFAIQEMKALRTELLINGTYEASPAIITLRIYLIQSAILCLTGLIALLLCLSFINYTIKKELKQIASQLGLFKSMGYQNREIATILWSRTLTNLILGFILGYLASLPIQIFVNHLMATSFSIMIQEIWTNGFFLAIFLALIPLGLSMVNLLAMNRYLNKNSLLMMQMSGGAQIESNEKPLRWSQKKIQFKNQPPWLKPVSFKQITSFCLIPLFFTLGSLIVLFQFNLKSLMADYSDVNQSTYQKEIDHFFTLNQGQNWYFDSDTNKYQLRNAEEYNLKTSEYHDFNDLIQKQNPEINQLWNTYFEVPRNEENKEIKETIQKLLFQIITTNLNYQVFNFQDFAQLLEFMVADYEKFFTNDFPDLKETITLIKDQWLENLDQLSKRLTNPQVQLTFNNLFIKPNVDYPILQIKLGNEGYWKFRDPLNWNLNLLNDSNQNVFLLNHYQLLKENNRPTNPRTIRVLMTNHFAKLNGVQVGEVVKAQLSGSLDGSQINLQVVGIETQDNATNNFYASESDFQQLIDETIPAPLFNSVYSKSQLFKFLNQRNDFQIQSDYFNFYFPSTSETISLIDIFQTPQNLIDFINWNNINGINFKSFALEKRVGEQKVADFNQLIDILLTFTLVVIFILLVVIVAISAVDFKNEIKLLRAFGYSNHWINFKLLKKYLLAIIVGITAASLITYFFWKEVIILFYNQLQILLHSPFNYLPILILGIVLFAIFGICWFLSLTIILKTKPTPE